MTKTKVKTYNFLSRNKVLLIMAGICIVAFLLRVILPMRVVFGQEYITFLEGDAYNRMWYATQIQDMPFFSGLLYSVEKGLLFPWLIAMLGFIAPIEIVGVWMPPVMAIGVIVLVYFIANNVFNSFVGLFSALFVAFIPSELFHRSLLGFTDHHIFEVLLMALLVYFTVKALREHKILGKYELMACGAMFLYLANWTGGILMVGILGLTGIVFAIQHNNGWRRAVGKLAIISGVGAAVYLGMGGFVRYFWWLPIDYAIEMTAALEQASGLATETIATIFQPVSQRTISELMPLFMPFGKFDAGVVLMNLHLFVFTFILGGAFLWYWRKDKANLFIIIWTIVILIITLNQRRFLYYLTLPVGILSAWGIYELGQRFRNQQQAIMIMITTTLLLVSIPILGLIGLSRAYSMPPEWHDALMWLREEPDNGMVTAWSDYGHWIQYTADKTPNLTPGPGGKKVVELFLTTDNAEAQTLMAELNTQYLIVDNNILTYKLPALEIISGRTYTEEALVYKLLNGVSVPYLTLEYESENIKIYEVIE